MDTVMRVRHNNFEKIHTSRNRRVGLRKNKPNVLCILLIYCHEQFREQFLCLRIGSAHWFSAPM